MRRVGQESMIEKPSQSLSEEWGACSDPIATWRGERYWLRGKGGKEMKNRLLNKIQKRVLAMSRLGSSSHGMLGRLDRPMGMQS